MKGSLNNRANFFGFVLKFFLVSALVGVFFVLMVILYVPYAMAGTVDLLKTGQITSYAEGDDGNLQKDVNWPSPRFTVAGDCVTDNLTGLMWAKNANLANGTKTWQVALDYAASLNSGGGLGGCTDWRLPNLNELRSLINAGETPYALHHSNKGLGLHYPIRG